MRKSIWTMICAALVILAAACSQLPTEPETSLNAQQTADGESIAFNQAMQYADAIDSLEVSAVMDSTTDRMRRHCALALIRLDLLLGRVQFIVMRHDNEEAIHLYEDARTAQQSAVEAARIDSFETAFEFIKESRYLGLEAAKLVIDEIQETREQIIERLQNEIDTIERMLVDITDRLLEEPNPPAARLARRSRNHLARGIVALHNGNLRRSAFHLRESKHLALIALRLLSPAG